MKHVSCTLLDHRYMSRGLAMIRSLRRVVPDAQIWVLCLDSAALDMFRQIREPGVHSLALAEFEASDPELVMAKADGRSLIEYYFSAKPSLIAHVMRAVPDADYVTYLDSDLWFFSDPAPAFAEAHGAPALLTPHRFPETTREHECFGRFNAGWLSFRRSPEGLTALQWWRARCLEWCFDRVDEANNRFADQRYLDQLIERFPGIHAVHHKGANLAPWNVGGYQLTLRNGAIIVDGDEPLLFFHVHGVRTVGRNLYVTPQDIYRGPPDPIQREHIYRPYLRVLRSIDRELSPLMPPAAEPLRQLSRRSTTGRLETLKGYLRIARAFARGALMRAPE
jgi:hypothetical protein